jgi:hypothetical protein
VREGGCAHLDGWSVGEQSCSSIAIPDSYWPSSKALSTRAACLVVSSFSFKLECDIIIREKKKKLGRVTPQPQKPFSRARPFGFSDPVPQPRNHHKAARKTHFNCMRIQRIARRMSSPLLFHNRQFLMATAGGSVDKPIEEAIHGKVINFAPPLPSP